MAKKKKKSIDDFVDAYIGTPKDDTELAELIVAELEPGHYLFADARDFLDAQENFYGSLGGVGFERG